MYFSATVLAKVTIDPKNPRIRDKCMAFSQTTIRLFLIFRFLKCLLFRVCLAYSFETWLMGLGISLVDGIKFMLISSRHICIWSISLQAYNLL